MTKINYLITKDQIVVYRRGKPVVVPNTNHAYAMVKEALVNKDWEALTTALDKAEAIRSYTNNKVVIEHGQVMYNGQALHSTLVDRIFQFMDEDLDAQPLINFLSNMMENPSASSVRELYDFLEVGKFPITEDGHFLAWKKVRDNYKDCHTGTFDNSIGAVLEMPRNTVDDNRDKTCSYGFHIASYNYAKTFQSGRMLIVKVNPKDVVSVPSDHNNEKCRVARYEVVGERTDDEDVLRKSSLNTDYCKKDTSTSSCTRSYDRRRQFSNRGRCI